MVYGSLGNAVAAFREDEPCLAPASPYAATKRMTELQLSTYRDLFGLGVFGVSCRLERRGKLRAVG